MASEHGLGGDSLEVNNMEEKLASPEEAMDLLRKPEEVERFKNNNIRPGVVSQAATQVLLKHMFGDTRGTLMLARRLEELGLKNQDAWLKGITTFDPESSEIIWSKCGTDDWRQDEGAEISANFNKKREGRIFVQKQRRQDYFLEAADDENNIAFRELSNVGKWNLKESVSKLLEVKTEHFQGELFDAFAENLDLLVEWVERVKAQQRNAKEHRDDAEAQKQVELTEAQVAKIEDFIGKISAGILDLDEGKGVNKQALMEKIMEEEGLTEAEAREKADAEYSELVLEALSHRQDKKYWHNVQRVSDQRHEDKWDDDDVVDLQDKKAAETTIINNKGEVVNYNPRLDSLRVQAGQEILVPVEASALDNPASIGLRPDAKSGDLESVQKQLTSQAKEAHSAYEAAKLSKDKKVNEFWTAWQSMESAIREITQVINNRKAAESLQKLSAAELKAVGKGLKKPQVKLLEGIREELGQLLEQTRGLNLSKIDTIGDRTNNILLAFNNLKKGLGLDLQAKLHLDNIAPENLRFRHTNSKTEKYLQLLDFNSLAIILNLSKEEK